MTQEAALHILKTGNNVFLTGAPGTGKTFVVNQYLDYLKKFGIRAAVTAPTGIAASHINGQTLHSFFGLGIKEELSQYDIENLTEKKYLWDNMKELKILIIDEISMVSPATFKSIDQILKTFKFSHEPFGGVQVVLVGDFFQLPPISSKNNEERFVFETNTWQELGLETCYLQKSYRQDDDTLLNILSEIRSNKVSEDSMNHFRSRYKKMPQNTAQITKLYTHNMDVNRINQEEINKIDQASHFFEAQTTGPKKWHERIFNSSLVLPKIELKIGALVFFIKNNYEKGYINGTLGTVIDFDVFGLPIIQTQSGKEIKAERAEWTATDKDGKPKATIKQIPLRLAWAITIHKSQGMTLDAAEIDLTNAFEPGQGYVALSRIKSLEGLRLMGLGEMALRVDPKVLDIDEDLLVHSDEIYQSFQELSDKEKQEKLAHYMKYLGGSSEKAALLRKTDEAAQADKKSSWLETQEYLSKELSISDIAEKRKLTEQTIFKHLDQIMKHDPEFDISYLQPPIMTIESVQKAQEKILQKNNKEDFLGSGQIKLKAIFTELKEEISYDDIRLSLFFLE